MSIRKIKAVIGYDAVVVWNEPTPMTDGDYEVHVGEHHFALQDIGRDRWSVSKFEEGEDEDDFSATDLGTFIGVENAAACVAAILGDLT